MKKVLLSRIVKSNAQYFEIKKKNHINYLDTSSITNNTITNIQQLAPQTDSIPSRAKRAIQKDTIIYSTVRPNLKHFGIIEKPLDNMVVSTGFTTLDIIDPEKYDPKYIFYNLSQQKYTEYLHGIAQTNTSAYPSIVDTDLLNLELSIPDDVSSQRKIADLLSVLDNKIELNNKINKRLEKMAKELYDYWFVQFDFPDENKRPLLSRISNLFRFLLKCEVRYA